MGEAGRGHEEKVAILNYEKNPFSIGTSRNCHLADSQTDDMMCPRAEHHL